MNVDEQVAAIYAGQKREAPSLAGPWEDRGEVFTGEGCQNSFLSQPTYLFEHAGTVFYMGDRWHQRDLGDSRYVWLPLDITNHKMTGRWQDEWRY